MNADAWAPNFAANGAHGQLEDALWLVAPAECPYTGQERR
jgi:hypothetical protein